MKMQKAAVYCAVVCGEEILLLERKEPKVLEFPGGGIEFGERPKEAVIRELREETGIKAGEEGVNLLCVSSCVYPNEKIQQIVILYSLELSEKPEIKISGEHKGYRWIKLSEIEKIPDLALSVKACLDEIKRKFFG